MRDIEKYGNDYNLNNDFEVIQVKYRRMKLLEFLSADSNTNRTVLEIGCGMEPLFLFYRQHHKHVIVEPCDVFFLNANKLMEDGNFQNIICYNDFFENIETELEEYTFDCIICSGLLHEVESPKEFLKHIFNLCIKNKTAVHINVPNMNSFHRLLAKESGLIKDVHDKSENNIMLQQYTNFDMETLKSMAEDVGFKIINSGSYFIKPFTHAQMQKLVDIGLLTDNILDGLYNMQKYMPDMGSEIFIEVKR